MQLFQNSMTAMQKQQAELQYTQLQLSTGLRVLKPSDDPVAAVKVLNLNTNLGVVDQFGRNANVAAAALSQQESVLDGVNGAIQRIRELAIQGNNPTNHDSARQSIALEIEERFKELLSLANTRDVNGEYLFAGAQTDRIPFVNVSGTVSYQGDQAQREVQIGDGATVAMRDSGDQVFMSVPNGNGTIQAKANGANAGTVLVGQYSSDSSFVADNYTITFTAPATPGAPVGYTVTDDATPTPNVIKTGVYDDGGTLTFPGVNMSLSGKPEVGDTISVQPTQRESMFDMVRGIINGLKTPGDSANKKSVVQNSMAQGIANLDQMLTAVNNQRASVGARLNNIESMETINEDFKLQLDTLKSETQDLDFAEAISRFNLQLTSLQAAQQAYVKTSELSLFRFM